MLFVCCVYFDPRLLVPNSSKTVDCLRKRAFESVGRSGETPGLELRRINSLRIFSLEVGSIGDMAGGGGGGSIGSIWIQKITQCAVVQTAHSHLQ